jgi:hypothetical protein
LHITEGSLVLVERDGLLVRGRQLAPSAQFAMRAFFDNQSRT